MHPVAPLAANVAGEHRIEPVSTHVRSLMADIDLALEEQVFHIPQRKRKTNVISATRRINSGDELK